MTETLVWWPVDEEFGKAWPYGSCNAVVLPGHGVYPVTVCGYPRREDGTCIGPDGGHPAPPGWTKP